MRYDELLDIRRCHTELLYIGWIKYGRCGERLIESRFLCWLLIQIQCFRSFACILCGLWLILGTFVLIEWRVHRLIAIFMHFHNCLAGTGDWRFGFFSVGKNVFRWMDFVVVVSVWSTSLVFSMRVCIGLWFFVSLFRERFKVTCVVFVCLFFIAAFLLYWNNRAVVVLSNPWILIVSQLCLSFNRSVFLCLSRTKLVEEIYTILYATHTLGTLNKTT